MVYFGDIGDNVVIVKNYFVCYGVFCFKDVNFVEYMIDVVFGYFFQGCDWNEVWFLFFEYSVVVKEFDEIIFEVVFKFVGYVDDGCEFVMFFLE